VCLADLPGSRSSQGPMGRPLPLWKGPAYDDKARVLLESWHVFFRW
jgi:hypothetical protein